jgi:hypothetical protein
MTSPGFAAPDAVIVECWPLLVEATTPAVIADFIRGGPMAGDILGT